VTIAQDVEGMSFPSKLYTSLAMGKSIVAVSESRSELRDIVESNDVGIWAELGDAQGLADAIRGLINDPDRCAKQGANARKLFEAEYTRAISSQKYADVFELAAKKN
jgi:glycosyltransferase involved in cell wall biosynthesis